MRKRLLIPVLTLLPLLISAQSFLSRPVSISLFNNATMLPPASMTAVFNQPVHPGLALGYEFGWKEKTYSKWFQEASVGFYHHRYAFNVLVLDTKAGYRRYLGHLSLEGSLHAGYMHMFLLTDRLVKQADGTYLARKGAGKPQFICGAGFGIGYNLGSADQHQRIFLDYDFRLQMPFVKNYVTLLPDGILSLGYQVRINR